MAVNPESYQQISVPDWDPEGSELIRAGKFKILDTTLRDGVQMPHIYHPSLDEKTDIIDQCAKMGIDAMDICLPGTGGSYYKEGVACAQYMKENYPQMGIVVLTRTIDNDVKATIQFAREAGVDLSAILFRGSSDYRLIAEDWSEDKIVEDMYNHSRALTCAGINVVCATEDTTRTRPEFLRRIFLAGKAGGAQEFCIADTVGHGTPWAIEKQTRWVKQLLENDNLHVQFHGHADTGQEVDNSLAAIRGGADVVHTTILGVGERAGNTPFEAFTSALEALGANRYDISHVVPTAKLVADSFQLDKVNIPVTHPLVGRNVYTNMSGIHAAAVAKAYERGMPEVAQHVYTAVGPAKVGREFDITIGRLSGVWNPRWVLNKIGVEITPNRVEELLRVGHLSPVDLTRKQVASVLTQVNDLTRDERTRLNNWIKEEEVRVI